MRHRLHVHSAQLRELVDELGAADRLGKHAQTIEAAVQLGDAVRQARTLRRLSQQDVATAAGVGRRFVVELEGGKATSEIGRMLAVCQAVGLTLSASDARHGLAPA